MFRSQQPRTDAGNAFLAYPMPPVVVVLKDVNFADVKDLIDFIYHGKVDIVLERLSSFLAAAVNLQVGVLSEQLHKILRLANLTRDPVVPTTNRAVQVPPMNILNPVHINGHHSSLPVTNVNATTPHAQAVSGVQISPPMAANGAEKPIVQAPGNKRANPGDLLLMKALPPQNSIVSTTAPSEADSLSPDSKRRHISNESFPASEQPEDLTTTSKDDEEINVEDVEMYENESKQFDKKQENGENKTGEKPCSIYRRLIRPSPYKKRVLFLVDGWTSVTPPQECPTDLSISSGPQLNDEDSGMMTRQKKLPCRKCGKLYSHNRSLVRHERFECGVGPQFTCQLCGKRYRRSNLLKQHLSKDHQSQTSAISPSSTNDVGNADSKINSPESTA